MIKRIIFSVTFLLLSGCSFTRSTPEVIIVPPVPPLVVAPAVHSAAAPPSITPTPGASIASLSPPQLLIAADQARTDAIGYVAWKLSKPENIDRLTTLTRQVNLTITAMKAGEIKGRYQPTDVIAARASVQALRSFLRTKGD